MMSLRNWLIVLLLAVVGFAVGLMFAGAASAQSPHQRPPYRVTFHCFEQNAFEEALNGMGFKKLRVAGLSNGMEMQSWRKGVTIRLNLVPAKGVLCAMTELPSGWQPVIGEPEGDPV